MYTILRRYLYFSKNTDLFEHFYFLVEHATQILPIIEISYVYVYIYYNPKKVTCINNIHSDKINSKVAVYIYTTQKIIHWVPHIRSKYLYVQRQGWASDPTHLLIY